jgi:hypothetical protein
MGLDSVELVMEVEEQFGVTISDENAFNFQTMGQLHDFLLEKCTGRRRPGCPTQSAFYRLRQAMIRTLGVPRQSLRLKTEVVPLLGTWQRGRTWRRLQDELGLALPRLANRAGAGVRLGAAIAAAVTFAVVTAVSGDPFIAFAAALFSLLPGVLLGFVLGLICLPTAHSPYKTLGGLARGVVTLNYEEFQTSEEPSTENDPIWDRLCDVVVDQLAVHRESLSRDTRFVYLFR